MNWPTDRDPLDCPYWRIMGKFLWWPKRLAGRWRWLVHAYWQEEMRHGKWVPVSWVRHHGT